MGLLEDDEKEQNNDEQKGIDDCSGVVKARDNSDRAFYKESVKVIEASDVILEVLDARDPLGTRCADLEKMVTKSGPNKHLVLLLNEIVQILFLEKLLKSSSNILGKSYQLLPLSAALKSRDQI